MSSTFQIMLNNPKQTGLIVVGFIVLVILVSVLLSGKGSTPPEEKSSHVILKREGKADIDFTEAKHAIEDNDKTFEKMSNVKRACEYIIDTGDKIPEEYKLITNEILELTNKCAIDDCDGQWEAWSPCEENVCSESKRTYKITKKGSYLGQSCPVKDGKVETKKCNPLRCSYSEMPYAKPPSIEPLATSIVELDECKANCLAMDDCHFITMDDNKMCSYYSIPDELQSITFEYDQNINTHFFKHKGNKIITPSYPSDITQELRVSTIAPISSNITTDQKIYTQLEGFALYSDTIDTFSNISSEECKTKCDINENCNFVSHDTKGNMCYLKSVLSENVTVFKNPTSNVYTLRIINNSEDSTTD